MSRILGILAILAALGAGVAIGGWLRSCDPPPSRADAERSDLLERRVRELREQANTASVARVRAEMEARQAAQDARAAWTSAAEAIARVRRPVAPMARAQRVAALVRTSTADVQPMAVAGRDGFWIAAPVLIELEAARTASAAWSRERDAMALEIAAQRRAITLGESERLALERVAERWHAGFDAEHALLLAERARPPPAWCAHTETWAAIAIAVVGGVAIGKAL